MYTTLNRILVCIAGGIFLLIAGGTFFVFITQRAAPGKNMRKADPSPAELHTGNVCNDFGQIRTVTKPEHTTGNGVTLVVSPWIAWTGNDTAFHEELVQKSRKIKSIITAYFTEYTEKELIERGENSVKADLLHKINNELVLGKISAVYFSEYIFLE